MSQDKPSVVSVVSVEVGGKECKGELEKAVSDVGKIAVSLLQLTLKMSGLYSSTRLAGQGCRPLHDTQWQMSF